MYTCEVKSDEIGTAGKNTCECGIGDGATVDKGESLQPDALCKTREEGVCEFWTKLEEIEATNESGVKKCLIVTGKDAYHFAQGLKL